MKFVLDNIVECGTVPAEGNSCVVVSGELTLYTDDAGIENGEDDTVKTSIQNGMDDGEFDTLNDDIVRVTYVPNLDALSKNSVSDAEDGVLSADDGNNNLVVGLLAGGALLVMLMIGAVYKKRRDSKKEDEDGDEITAIPDFKADPTYPAETDTVLSPHEASTVQASNRHTPSHHGQLLPPRNDDEELSIEEAG